MPLHLLWAGTEGPLGPRRHRGTTRRRLATGTGRGGGLPSARVGRRQFGSVRKLPSGRYQASYWREGQRHTGPTTWPRKGDALAWLAETETSIRRGTWADPEAGQVTLGEVAERWSRQQGHLRPKALLSVESLLRSRVLPRWGAVQVASIRPSDIRTWVSDLLGEGLSASRVRQAYGVLSRVLDMAVEEGELTSHPCIGVKLPPVKRSEVRSLTVDQIEDLVEAMPPPYDLFVSVIAYTGMRFGEAVALRRHHCDVERGRLVVAESATEVAGQIVFGETKTHQHRTVVLPHFLSELLAAHLAEAVLPGPDELVFRGPTGGPLRYSNFRTRVWLPAVKKMSLEWATPHTLRHTAATLLIGEGASVKDVQAQLGHADASVTLDVYAGVIAGHAADLATRLDTLYEQTRARRTEASRTNRARQSEHLIVERPPHPL